MSAVDDATHLLEVEGLSAWYERDRPVLTDVSFALEEGEAVGLIGLNGAGKTTMLTSLCDVHRGARLGVLRYRGGDVRPGDERFKAARYLSLADDDSFPTWNLEAFIGFLERAYRLRPDRGRLEELIEGFRLRSLPDHILLPALQRLTQEGQPHRRLLRAYAAPLPG